MGVPRSKEARLFYRCAMQRLEDSRILWERGRTTGAVYLAGYSVECMLKALIMERVPRGRQGDVRASFRGARAHSVEWLMLVYRRHGGDFPPEIVELLNLLNEWTTELRYDPATIRPDTAGEFLQAAEDFVVWSDGRF